MLSYAFRSRLPQISSSKVIGDLLRSFRLRRPRRMVCPPSWDLNKVLVYLRGHPFEPLKSCDFRSLSKKTLFLLALATAKRVSELQALSFRVTRVGQDRTLMYLPEFVAKTETPANPIPRSFRLASLKEFVGDLVDEMLLCPVRCLDEYLSRTKDIKGRPRSLFVSPRNNSRAMSKNGISFFLREVISGAGAVGAEVGRVPSAHSVRSVATSVAFTRNWSLSQVLEAVTWKSSSVFASFYLRDVAQVLGEVSSLGSFVAAGQVIGPSE